MRRHQSHTRSALEGFLTDAVMAGALLLAGVGPAHAADPATPDDWRFSAELHLWMSSLGGNTRAGDDIDISFSDLLDHLDLAFMGGIGARKGKFSLGADIVYFKVADKNGKQFSVPVGPRHRFSVPVAVDGKVVVKAWISTALVGYNLIDREQGWLDVVGGARYLWIDAHITLDENLSRLSRVVQDSGSAGNWDGVVGVRGEINLDAQKKWYLSYYGDVGTGASDLTWAAQAGIGYRFEKFDVRAGYRHMDWNLGSGAAIDDLELGGVIVGARFKF